MSSSSKDGFLAVCGAFTALSTLTVGLRFACRRQQKLPLMVDDWIMIPALVSYIGATICGFLSVADKVLGYSSFDFTPAQTLAMAKESQQLYYAIIAFLSFSLACTKLSALFFYRRIFCTGPYSRWFNVATIITIVMVICWVITFELFAALECGTHFSALWNGTYSEYCSKSFAYVYALVVSDFVLDVWILFMPIPLILSLHLSLPRKLSVMGVFLLVFVGLGASIARMVLTIQVETAGDSGLFTDQERTVTKSLYFNMLEGGISIVAVNLPSLWFFFTAKVPEKVLRSVRSMISLPSHRRKGLDNSDATSTPSDWKIDESYSIDSSSTRPSSNPSSLRYHPEANEQQSSGIATSQKAGRMAVQDAIMEERRGEDQRIPERQDRFQDPAEQIQNNRRLAEESLC